MLSRPPKHMVPPFCWVWCFSDFFLGLVLFFAFVLFLESFIVGAPLLLLLLLLRLPLLPILLLLLVVLLLPTVFCFFIKKAESVFGVY